MMTDTPESSPRRFEILNAEIMYSGFFRLERYTLRHTLFAGGWSEPITRELFCRGSCVAVLPYDPRRDEVILLEQFRVGAIHAPERAWITEIVAGAIEEGENPQDVAYRETLEEAGCTILSLTEIQNFFTTPGGSSESITLYYAEVDTSHIGGIHGLAEEHEDILVRAVKFDAAMQLLENKKIDSAIALIALQWLALHRERLRKGHGE